MSCANDCATTFPLGDEAGYSRTGDFSCPSCKADYCINCVAFNEFECIICGYIPNERPCPLCDHTNTTLGKYCKTCNRIHAKPNSYLLSLDWFEFSSKIDQFSSYVKFSAVTYTISGRE